MIDSNMDYIEVIVPGNAHKVDSLYGWISVDENGNEGILGQVGVGPFVVGDLFLAHRFKHLVLAALAKAKNGYKARLVKFDKSAVIEEIEP